MTPDERVQMRVEGERAWVQVRVGKSIWSLGGADSARTTEARVAALRRAIAEAEADARADVIEQCVKVVKSRMPYDAQAHTWEHLGGYYHALFDVAAAIRKPPAASEEDG